MKVIICLLLCVILLFMYMMKVANEHHILQHEAKISGHADCLRVLFISDVHNRTIRQKGLADIGTVEAVIIGGDFCDKRTSEDKLIKNLSTLSKLGPIYFVWGNNDREFGEVRLRQIFAQFQVNVVVNDAVQLIGRNNKTWIAAIEDTSTKNYDFQKALAKCAAEDVILCVSHNPQVFYKARCVTSVSMLFGGHLHGGQIRIGKYGLHPNGSFSVRHGIPTLISNGYGTTLLPLRLGAKPQLHVVNIIVDNNSQ